jgi:hypothetical protein
MFCLTENMLMYATQGGLFAAALTPLIIDGKQNLNADPTDQIVYYLKQHSTILNQISEQISSIAPEVSIPSTPPPPYPPFKPSTSYVVLNVLWFFALVYSILGALIATLIQKWIRKCQRTLQRDSADTIKITRFRHYLFKQLHAFQLIELAPTILHSALLFFLVGLCIFTWNLNTEVASVTTIYSSTCFFLFYFFAMPESPGFPIGDPNLLINHFMRSDSQMKMEELEGQYEWLVQWLIENLEEDAEMESFVLAIPGSFNTDWGVEVWKKLSEITEDKSGTRSITPAASTLALVLATHPRTYSHLLSASPLFHGDEVPNVYTRIHHLLDTCKDPLFEKPEEQRGRTRACIEATALLVCRAKAKLDHFGDIAKLLGDTGIAEKTRDLSSMETDGPFVVRWTCLSLLTIRSILERETSVREKAKLAVEAFVIGNDTGDDQALAGAQTIDGTFRDARSSLSQLYNALTQVENPSKEQVILILDGHRSQVSQLENIHTHTDRFSPVAVDQRMYDVQSSIVETSQGITRQLPGVQFQFDNFDSETGPVAVQFSQLVEWSRGPPTQFIFPEPTLRSICSLGSTFRSTLEGMWDPGAHQELLENVKGFLQDSTWKESLLQRQLWRLQDLRDGGGLGFTVELFFLALKQLLSTTSSNESHSPLFIGAFRAITSDWVKYKHSPLDSPGTQRLLLDMILPNHGIISEFRYPTYIIDEFLELLGNILKGQRGPHLDDAMQVLLAPGIYSSHGDEQEALRAKVVSAIDHQATRERQHRSISIFCPTF